MSSPIGSLSILFFSVLLAFLLFRPKRGFFDRWQQLTKMSERVRVEDALKHIYNYESRQQAPTVQSLAGVLGLSEGRIVDLIAQMEAKELVEVNGNTFRLTDEGRDYALRVIRAHRLWEYYLCNQTGFGEDDWHREAERREHSTSLEEMETMAYVMGNPLFDPHGAPIPTATLEIAPHQGQLMTDLAKGEWGRIVHIEDEPEEVYAQLVAEGIYLGMKIQMLEITRQRVRIWGDGNEHILAPMFARNISVLPLTLEEENKLDKSLESLSTLDSGESAMVVQISRACRGLERRRLMDFGIVPGTIIKADMKSIGGNPTAYHVRGTTIALRKEQAEKIHVTKQKEETQ